MLSVVRRRCSRREETGAIALIAAIVSLVLLVVSAFVVDIGSTWARRGQLQVQADRAAVFAADSLPAGGTAARQAVAAQAAYYIACHPVQGQRELGSMPDCTSSTSPSDPEIQAYGQQLMQAGQVSFPTATEVKVTTPPARIDFSFGKAIGVDKSVQQKTATAKAYSPGTVEPIGLSLSCMLGAANNLGLTTLNGVLPLNYMSVGAIKPEKVTTTWPSSQAQDPGMTLDPLTPPSAVMNTGPVTVTATGSGWDAPLALVSSLMLEFRRGSEVHDAVATGVNVAGLVSTGTFTVPSEVMKTAGTWQVKVAVLRNGTWVYSKSTQQFDVTIPSSTADLLGCGRTLKSPRDCTSLVSDPSCTNASNPGNLEANIKAGLDHSLVAQSGLLSASTPDSLSGLLDALVDPTVLTKCSNNSSIGDYKDIAQNIQSGDTPNCVHMEQGAIDDKEFTEGFLGAPQETSTGTVSGRLVCDPPGQPCGAKAASSGQVLKASDLGLLVNHPDVNDYYINNDHFTDFVKDPSLLNSATFFSLTTYLTPGLPAVTPKSQIDPAIYGSQRFFWVPVMSTPIQSTGNDAGDFPILTFRPVFVTGTDVNDALTGVEPVDLVLKLVDSWVLSLLGLSDPSAEHNGILMNNADHTLRALRFMTIEPTALPAVPADYQGPVSDYVGTGPKVIRLVK